MSVSIVQERVIRHPSVFALHLRQAGERARPVGTLDLVEAYTHYFPLIEKKCARMLRDPEEARDIAQETFIRLSKQTGILDNPLTTTAWVYRTATRLAIDQIRKRKRRGELLDTRAEEVMPKGEAQADNSLETRHLIERLAEVVPEKELTAALLTRVDGLGQAEAAEVMKTSDRNIRRWLKRFDERAEKVREALQ